MKRIIAVLGDYYHPKERIVDSLHHAVKFISELEDIDLVEIQLEQLCSELGKKPDAVILFKENRINPTDEKVDTWMTEEIGTAITEYVNQGGGWLGWHSGLASYPPDSNYIKLLKGHFEYHPELHQQVKYTSVDGNDSFGAVAFDILDEHYFVNVNEAETNIFLTSQSEDGHSVAGWSHSFGNGRVSCLTPAHNKEGLENGEFIKLLAKTIKWVCD
ncbi:ThuA domain-containing protein [Metabacillus malikii]|uniref:Type 1 glutamine amidotransferase n=1 Tax=Metabacillus malikii TaxID=1504265 RepID=A0ABT9ZCM0_9BACI|nr:ThuA domain-containing protein [Metabacillus malikii]MDQ0229010.1 type 1 glutamine amidotransferase [Metabacillus malikii]